MTVFLLSALGDPEQATTLLWASVSPNVQPPNWEVEHDILEALLAWMLPRIVSG